MQHVRSKGWKRWRVEWWAVNGLVLGVSSAVGTSLLNTQETTLNKYYDIGKIKCLDRYIQQKYYDPTIQSTVNVKKPWCLTEFSRVVDYLLSGLGLYRLQNEHYHVFDVLCGFIFQI